MAQTKLKPQPARKLDNESIFILADGSTSPLQVAKLLIKGEHYLKLMTIDGAIFRLSYGKKVFIAPEKVKEPCEYLHNLVMNYAETA